MKIACVIQRYGDRVIGGGETFARLLVEHLHPYFDIEVITTCARDYQTWALAYEPGVTILNGIPIRRFPVAVKRNISALHLQEERIYHSSHTIQDEIQWATLNGPYAPDLIRFIRDNQEKYDLFLFFTFRYFHSFGGIPAVFNKAVLIPFAENEPSLYLNITKSLFSLVRGIIFVTPEEEQIVKSALGVRHFSCPTDIIPIGMNIPGKTIKKEGKNKYILYLGRIEPAKGCRELFSYFLTMKKEGHNIPQMVIAGPKSMEIPNHPDIEYVGVISENEKINLLRDALFLIMPSPHESLSLVTLEAWTYNTPVLINKTCKVLMGHCTRSNGGLWYDSYNLFAKTVRYLNENPSMRKELGRMGYQYVKENYDWNLIIEKYKFFFKKVIAKDIA